MKRGLIFLLAIVFPCISYANLESITWKGTYYASKPIRTHITQNYCKEHTPGSFIHIVNPKHLRPLTTNKGIKLLHSTFHIDKVGRVYLIYGDFIAAKKTKTNKWQDHIHYYLYKFSEAGVTRGIWYSNDCKGLYRGVAIKIAGVKKNNI